MRTTRTITLTSTDRSLIRHELINHFLTELPGTGTGEECSHYIYFVEQLSSGSRVFLKRPTNLNKGFDFEVHVENMNFNPARRTARPSHTNLLDDLRAKLEENPDHFSNLLVIINSIYNCQPLDENILTALNFQSGLPVETVLKIIKWLFIEQDITYWNWSGRAKLMGSINELLDE